MTKPERPKSRRETVMDVTAEQIARVYARAFLGAIDKSANPAGLIEEVQSLVDEVLDKFPDLEKALRSELVGAEEKQRLIDRVFGGRMSIEVLHFLKVLANHGRLGLVRPIARLLKKMFAEMNGRADVELRVASELDAGLQNEIVDSLRRILNKEPVLEVRVDPALLGGMVVRVGDRVYDGSLHTRFEHVRRAMIDRATNQIEADPRRFLSATE